ncbi:MAG: hypothetical protein Q8S84_00405 [bacterium]|nr:hypothetical protein [bacterium]
MILAIFSVFRISIFSGIFISLFFVLHFIFIFSFHHISYIASLMKLSHNNCTVHIAFSSIISSFPSIYITLFTLNMSYANVSLYGNGLELNGIFSHHFQVDFK